MKRILTSDDVLALVRRGETELVMGPEDRLTDLARELAQRRGVKLVDAAQAAARTAAAPDLLSFSSPDHSFCKSCKVRIIF